MIEIQPDGREGCMRKDARDSSDHAQQISLRRLRCERRSHLQAVGDDQEFKSLGTYPRKAWRDYDLTGELVVCEEILPAQPNRFED